MFKPTADFRALVADPSAHMAGLVADMLRSLKIRLVDEVHDLPSVQRSLSSQTYRLILIDAELGPPDDLVLIRKLRQADGHPNRNVPIIMTAATPSAAIIAAARDAGVTEFLRKPFAAQHIASRLEAIQSAPREFVSGENYAGPDRRRRDVAGAPTRRAADSSKSA
jgi:DNA-binding response OmpR family regulator